MPAQPIIALTELEEATVAAVASMLNLTRADGAYLYMPDADMCGFCGERLTRLYHALAGQPVCGPCRRFRAAEIEENCR